MGIEKIQVIAAICFIVCYFPQLYRIIKTRRSDDVSISFLVLATIGLVLQTTFTVMAMPKDKALMLIVTGISTSMLSLVTLIFVIIYRIWRKEECQCLKSKM